MSGCCTTEELAAFSLGELPESRVEQVAEHLEACPRCAAAVKALDTESDGFIQDLRAAAPAESHRADGTTLPRRVGEYDLLGELGRGGMGIVYKARDRRLGRVVALKMLLGGAFEQASRRDRFRWEAEAVARLQHPNIVQLYDVGEYETTPGERCPYFTLELVEGGSLADHLGSQPPPPGQAAAWVEQVARAAQYAHERGIIHRDLKPSNVLLTPDGQPKLCDFGIAKGLEGAGVRTQTGLLVGTPEYMAPEQFDDPRRVTARVDVYALGAILYALLVSRPPFRAAGTPDTLALIRRAEPVPPRRWQPSIPADLQTICLKCLAKEPEKRYATAGDLADDLGRFLGGVPIRARPASPWERAGKWARRRPAVAALVLVIGLVLAVGLPGVTALWLRAERARDAADEERGRAETSLYFSRIARADREYLFNDIAEMKAQLAHCLPEPGRPDLRGWEWHYLNRLARAELLPEAQLQGWVYALAFSPDGGWLAAGCGSPVFNQFHGGEPGELRVWRIPGGAAPEFRPPVALLSVFAAAVSPDGSRLAVVEGHLRDQKQRRLHMLEARTGAEIRSWPLADGVASRCLLFSAEGRTLFGVGGGATAWEAQSGRQLWTHAGPEVTAVRGGDQELLLLGADGMLGSYDPATGHRRAARPVLPPAATLPNQPLALSDDGRRAAGLIGDRTEVRVADTQTGKALCTVRSPGDEIMCVALSPDGRLLAMAGADAGVHVWRVDTGKELYTFRGHISKVCRLAFSPAGDRLASGGWDGAVKVWDLTRRPEYLNLAHPQAAAIRSLEVTHDFVFPPDGQTLVVAWSPGSEVVEAELPSGRRRSVASAGTGKAYHEPSPSGHVDCGRRALAPDGRRLAGWSPGDRRRLLVWDVPTGKELATFAGHQGDLGGVRWSADGRRLLSYARIPDGGYDIKAWPAQGGECLASLPLEGLRATCLTISPDGRYAAVGVVPTGEGRSDRSAVLQVWDLDEGRLSAALAGHQEAVQAAGFAPDGRNLASAGVNGDLFVWAWPDGRRVQALQSPVALYNLSFSPDGRRLAGAGRESVLLWDVASGVRVMTLRGVPRGHGDYPVTPLVKFSRDGRHLAATQWNRTINVWSVEP